MARFTSPRVLCAFVLVAIAACLPAAAQTDSLLYGRLGVEAPERSDAGDWYGTWYYASRTRKMVLWIRETDGLPEVKLRLQDKTAPALSFTTDWTSQVNYNASGKAGEFALRFEHRDENTISGRWAWQIRSSDGTRDEAAQFTMYRAGYGRQLVVQFADLERKEFHGQVEKLPELIWTFRKASRREVLWSELPF